MSSLCVCPTFDLGDIYKKYCQKWSGAGWAWKKDIKGDLAIRECLKKGD